MADIATPWSPHSGVDESTIQQVKVQATNVGHNAVEAGAGVAHSVAEQSREVAQAAGRQARDLLGRVQAEVSDQANAQQRRVVDGLYALGGEVTQMADQGGQSGPATQLARQAAERINQAAQWLEHRDPGDVVDEVKAFASRRPGTFLVGAAVLGVVAGRYAKNVSASPDQPPADATTAAVPPRQLPPAEAPSMIAATPTYGSDQARP